MTSYRERMEWIITRVNAVGEEVETVFDVTVSITPGDPGRISGPPEDCYPPEPGEVEILAIKQGKLLIPERDWEAYGFTDDEIEKVMEAAYDIEGGQDCEERD